MSNELGPVSRSLVDAARDGLGPDPGAASRVRAKVAAAIAGVGVAATGAKAAAATGATAKGTGIAIKLAVVVLVGGAIVGTVLATRKAEPIATPAIVAPVATLDEAPSAPERVAAPDGTAAQATSERPNAGRPNAGQPNAGQPNAGQPNAGRPEPGRPTAGRPAAGRAEPLGREVRLIDQATAALRAGQLDEALAAIRIYDEDIGDRGQLAEEAAAIAIEATCRLHGAVADRLAEFDRKWPSSAQRARLTAACATH